MQFILKFKVWVALFGVHHKVSFILDIKLNSKMHAHVKFMLTYFYKYTLFPQFTTERHI